MIPNFMRGNCNVPILAYCLTTSHGGRIQHQKNISQNILLKKLTIITYSNIRILFSLTVIFCQPKIVIILPPVDGYLPFLAQYYKIYSISLF